MCVSRVVVIWACVMLALACSNDRVEETAPSAPEAVNRLLSKLTVNETTPNVLYTYMDDKGQYQTVDKSADVPDPFRNDVIVVNLALSPGERAAAAKVAVADLERRNADGSFVLRLEDRTAFETAIKLKRQWGLTPLPKPEQGQSAASSGPPPAPNTDKIVLYSTSWCGYCKKLRSFLNERKIPFIERDVEQDPAAQSELMARCRAAGVACQGVPILDIKGRIIPGYNPQQLEQLLAAPPKP